MSVTDDKLNVRFVHISEQEPQFLTNFQKQKEKKEHIDGYMRKMQLSFAAIKNLRLYRTFIQQY